jgi:hypothetical protein
MGEKEGPADASGVGVIIELAFCSFCVGLLSSD